MDEREHDEGSPGEPLSIRAYARRRGVSAPAVLNAITSGRLRASVVDTERGKKIGDPDLADREWDDNTDLSRAPGYVKGRAAHRAGDAPPAPAPGKDGSALTLLEASAREKEFAALLKELDYLERTGTLVDAVAIEARLVDVHTRARTKLLGLVAKARTAIPHLTRADLVILDRLIREALEELSEQTPAPPAEGAA